MPIMHHVPYKWRVDDELARATYSPPTLTGAGHHSERFLPARGTFKVGSTSESHWLQPMLILTRSLMTHTSKCGWAIRNIYQLLPITVYNQSTHERKT